MQKRDASYTNHHQGDKVRIRSGNYKGQKGVIHSTGEGLLEIQLTEDIIITISPQSITNYSLAARKAWQTMRHQ